MGVKRKSCQRVSGQGWDLKEGVRPSFFSDLLDRHSPPSPAFTRFPQSFPSFPVSLLISFPLLSSLPDPWSSRRSLLCFSG